MTFTSRITLDMRSGPAANDKASNSNTKTKYEICSKLTIKTPERCCLILYQWTKIQCPTLFLSQDIKQNVLSFYFNSW